MAKKHGNYYYEKLSAAAGHSYRAATLLDEVINDYAPQELDKTMEQMHAIEHAADIDKHLMMSKLVHEFITPIEREDIILLSQELDDITDQIEDILRCLYMYDVKTIRPEAKEFSKLVVQSCGALKNAMDEFHNFKKSSALKDHIIEVNRIEGLGDDLYTKVIRKLFTTVDSTREIISWVKIFDLFENSCDSCEHVANTMERITLKNI